MNVAYLERPGTTPPGWMDRVTATLTARSLVIGLLVCTVLTAAYPVLAQDPVKIEVDFKGEAASEDARKVADWIIASGDNSGLPFIIVDKISAKVFVFTAQGDIRGAASALLGLGFGDDSVPGIGQRKLATITPAERTTAAGRFEAASYLKSEVKPEEKTHFPFSHLDS